MTRGCAGLWLAVAAAVAPLGRGAADEPRVEPSAAAFRVSRSSLGQAVGGHPSLGVASADVERAVALSFRADAAYIPQADVEVQLLLLPEMRGNQFSGYSDTSTFGPFFNGSATFGMPLIAFGQLFALRDLGDAVVAAAEAERSRARGALERRAVELFAAWIAAQKRVTAARSAEDVLLLLESRLDAMEEQLDPDFDPVDVMKLRVRQADLAFLKLDATRRLGATEAALRAFLRLPDSTPLEVDPRELGDVALEPLAPLADYVELAVVLRPEVQLASAAFAGAAANVQWRISQFFPGIGVVGQANVRRAPSADVQRGVFNLDPFNSLGGGAALGLRWPLDLGERIADLQDAFAKREQARALYDAWKLQLRVDLADAYAAVEQQTARVRILAEAQHAAATWLEQAAQRYPELDARVDPLLTAWNADVTQHQKLIDAWSDYHMALARLHQLAGVGTRGKLPR